MGGQKPPSGPALMMPRSSAQQLTPLAQNSQTARACVSQEEKNEREALSSCITTHHNALLIIRAVSRRVTIVDHRCHRCIPPSGSHRNVANTGCFVSITRYPTAVMRSISERLRWTRMAADQRSSPTRARHARSHRSYASRAHASARPSASAAWEEGGARVSRRTFRQFSAAMRGFCRDARVLP